MFCFKKKNLKNKKNPLSTSHFIMKSKYNHCYEGDDDMPAHAKTQMFGVSLSIPISDGHLAIGQWQGIYLYEC